MAIVASGYLFSDELVYHVDVYQGDTPASLLEQYAPGSRVKNAAVLDVDVPGQTVPFALEADEPVVVVGASPRTSVFVYGESPTAADEAQSDAPDADVQEAEAVQEEKGEVVDVLPAGADADAVAAEPSTPADLGVEVEELVAAPPAPASTPQHPPTPPPLASPPSPPPPSPEPTVVAAPEPTVVAAPAPPAAPEPKTDERFLKTRRLRKPRSDRGTRRAPRTLKIELA